MKPMTSFAATLALLPLLGAIPAGLAVAQTAPAAELTLGQVVARLESLGYTAIGDAERDDGVWEVEATSPAGVRVELDVDPRSGQILRERQDND